MITIKQVIAWLKEGVHGTSFFNSTIDKNLDKCIGVYARRNGLMQPVAIGGSSGYGIRSITLLVHWTKNADHCEEKTNEVLEFLKNSGTEELIGGKACWIVARQQPVSIGRDELGIFENVLDFEIYYRKED